MGRLRRMVEAFEVEVKVSDCDSSGSEHSPEEMMDLSDLVNSFIQKGNGVIDGDFETRIDDECSSDGIDGDMEEMKESLKRLLRFEDGDDVRRSSVLSEVEKARWCVNGDNSSAPLSDSKRRLMAHLRDQGLDAGVCKSKWEKGRVLSGDHEYIDVNVTGTRYIIIVSLVEEFEIARPTDNYGSLLEILPQIAVCKVEELKEIVKIMSKAIKKSMNQMKMSVPPWRRREYIQAKWFGSYKRTTNEFPTKNLIELNVNNKKTVGFKSRPGNCYGSHEEDFARKDFGFKMGNLALVMNGAS